MQWPSYPKETRDQWPPIEGDHSEWGGACNQSINIGYSLGEQYNLMRHTHTSPFIWLPPPFCLLPKLLLEPFLHVLFLSSLLRLSPVFDDSLCTSLSLSALLFSPLMSSPTPIDISEIPRGRDTQKQGMQLCWSGGRWRRRWWKQGGGSWGGEGQANWLCKDRMDSCDWAIVFTGLRSGAVRSSDEVVSVSSTVWWEV